MATLGAMVVQASAGSRGLVQALTRRDTQPRIEPPRGPVERFAEAVVETLADTALAQEIHMLLTHILCDSVETELATREGAQA